MSEDTRERLLSLAHNSADEPNKVVERAKAYETYVAGNDQDVAEPSSKGKEKKGKK